MSAAIGRCAGRLRAPPAGIGSALTQMRAQQAAAERCNRAPASRLVVAMAAMRPRPGTLSSDIAHSHPAPWLHAAMPPGTRAC
ncbi:hypothetical protein IA64_18600 [Xanthomonas arboricola pv. celebensis]|nr:hypothetical protein IA64_18600 [Xanthomonas arboricola pv. celebensis]